MDKRKVAEGVRMALAKCGTEDGRWQLLGQYATMYRIAAGHGSSNPQVRFTSTVEPGLVTSRFNMSDERQKLRALARAVVPGLTAESFSQLCGAGDLSVEAWVARERPVPPAS